MTDFHLWVRWHTCHAHGYGEIQWSEIDVRDYAERGDTTEALASFLEEMESQHSTHSERWRGVKGAYDTPPEFVLEQQRVSAERKIHFLQLRLERLRAQTGNEWLPFYSGVKLLAGKRVEARFLGDDEQWEPVVSGIVEPESGSVSPRLFLDTGETRYGYHIQLREKKE